MSDLESRKLGKTRRLKKSQRVFVTIDVTYLPLLLQVCLRMFQAAAAVATLQICRRADFVTMRIGSIGLAGQ